MQTAQIKDLGTLLTEQQAAEYCTDMGLDIKKKTLCQYRWKKTGPNYTKHGNKVRYPQKMLEKWITDALVIPGQSA